VHFRCQPEVPVFQMIIIVMGVTGSGKTTVGKLLAPRLGWDFLDADDFHSTANKAKMHQGIPLTDADRIPWLTSMHAKLEQLTTEKRNAVLACSALKRGYRQLLTDGIDARIVYLKGSYQFIAERLRTRKGHFADEHILAGQFADLEEPTPDEAVVVDVTLATETIITEILRRVKLPSA
jgi:gluconokinase